MSNAVSTNHSCRWTGWIFIVIALFLLTRHQSPFSSRTSHTFWGNQIKHLWVYIFLLASVLFLLHQAKMFNPSSSVESKCVEYYEPRVEEKRPRKIYLGDFPMAESTSPLVQGKTSLVHDGNYRNYSNSSYGDPNIVVAPCSTTVTIDPLNTNPSIIPKSLARQMIFPNSDNCGFQPVTEEYSSYNQKLVGQANPKTLNTPIIPNRLYDSNVWSYDSFIVPTGINRQATQELTQNGYEEMINTCTMPCPPQTVREGFEQTTHVVPSQYERDCQGQPRLSYIPIDERNTNCQVNPTRDVHLEQRIQRTMLNAPYGYFPENARQQIPVNFPPGQEGICNSPSYNAELNTTLLQPNLVAYSNVNVSDANQSNLGISYTQPHIPTKLVDIPGTDSQAFVEIDPVTFAAREWTSPSTTLSSQSHTTSSDGSSSPYQTFPGTSGTLDPRSIYDPRFTGYGTSYRHYVDDMTGQPRFFYDDINAHRQYNYLTKSKIDFLPQMASSGAYEPQRMSNLDIRQTAEQAFHNDTLQQRTELQDRLMQKIIHRTRQRKEAPIRVHN